MDDKDSKSKAALGKMEPSQKAVRIQELSDKVGFAIRQFEAAQKKFEQGQDSYREWQNIVKLLTIQVEDVQHFLAVANHNLGVLHAGKREFKKAKELFEKAIALDPDYAIAYYNLAVVHKNLGDVEACRAAYQKAKELGYQS
jgi:tetratricopeptide (TPR) repeat protein